MKIIRKFTPVSLYDMPGMEQWLEEMANQGLFPLRMKEWTTFRDDGKPGTRFRLEPYYGKSSEPEQAQLDLYREAGWEYACTIGKAYFLFYTTDPNAPELHTDWVTKAQSLDQLIKRVKRGKWHRILYSGFFFLYFAFLALLPGLLPFSRFDVQPDRWAYLPQSILGFTSIPIVLFLLALILFYGKEIREFRQLLRLHRNLSEGMPPPSQGPSKKIRRWHQFTLWFGALGCVVMIFHFLARSIPLAWFPLPYPALTEVDGQFLLTYEEMFERSPREKENVVEWNSSLLAPVWYTVEQSGYRVYDQESEEEAPLLISGDVSYYHAELNMTRMVLTIPATARSVAKSVMSGMRLVNLYWEYEEIDHPDADFVILAKSEGDPWQLAAVGRGHQVAVFRYLGTTDLAERLDHLVAMVNQ